MVREVKRSKAQREVVCRRATGTELKRMPLKPLVVTLSTLLTVLVWLYSKAKGGTLKKKRSSKDVRPTPIHTVHSLLEKINKRGSEKESKCTSTVVAAPRSRPMKMNEQRESRRFSSVRKTIGW